MENKTLKLDIVSDVACPWCYVGKKNIETALENLDGYDIEVNWRPFQLDPSIPETGLDRDAYFKAKFGTDGRSNGMLDRLEEKGREVGINFDWMKKIPNTLRLHNLLHEATKEGFANDLKEAFFEAYFEKVIDMTDENEILKITAKFGWDATKSKQIMNDESITSEVKRSIQEVQQRGVSGVPFFILNNQYGISGAQPPEALVQWIKGAGEKIQEEANSCAVDDPNC
ncbi:DsbA family oxidoreductase [Portibacter lacus]|uniref:DSBA oxidoreductase n=1 Tax=Portibacter lacus TaxID=1099794 RepID=A0AA37WEF3_9BACT|nr:DsbA family oxidoreductase [Portibacter lacus]GLR17232.1 DSBA oxidoreductase [Portibacter lacus]